MQDVVLQQQMQQNPALLPFEEVIRNFYTKHLSFDSLKPQYVAIYVEAFTLEELRAMNAFYLTDVGRKTIQLMPQLIQKGAARLKGVNQE